MDEIITIRPSSLSSFLNCPYQWMRVHLYGERTIPSARAVIGTSIHKSAEVMWNEAILTGKKDLNISKAEDIAVAEYEELSKQDAISFDDVDPFDAARIVASGAKAFMQDIAPITDIPDAVEKRYSFDLGHNIRVSGSCDYVKDNILGDIKSTKRKPATAHYLLQQSCYAILRDMNNEPTTTALIQAVVFGKETRGEVIELELDKAKAKYVVNHMAEKIKIWKQDVVDEKMLFGCNTEWYLCSPKYCSLHGKCPATKR